jgi:hypothetical protein
MAAPQQLDSQGRINVGSITKHPVGEHFLTAASFSFLLAAAAMRASAGSAGRGSGPGGEVNKAKKKMNTQELDRNV